MQGGIIGLTLDSHLKVDCCLNGNPNFALQILVAYFESFLKHYNKILFSEYFLRYKTWKLQYCRH